jgi:hypothetical protein
MVRVALVCIGLTATTAAAAAKDVVDTNVKLVCAVAGTYVDGSRIRTSGVEEISIEIKRGAASNIRIKSNQKTYQGSLLRSTRDQVAFGFAGDTSIDNVTLSFVYEISLDKLKLRRTVMPLFSTGSSLPQSFEGECSRQ